MSFNNNFVTKIVSKNSDSFDERICDDLSEEILQYLPFEVKIKLQYVSKQFQRTAFQRVYEFNLRQIKKGYTKRIYTKQTYHWNYSVKPENESELKPIKSVLKKCTNLRRIDLDGLQTNNNQISKLIIQMITEYCNHVNEFRGKTFNQNFCESQEFCRKFGPKLKYFGSAKHVFNLNLFPNIESIDEYSVVKPIRVEEVLQLKQINHLKKLEFVIDLSKEHLLPQVMQKFQKLTHLTLKLRTDELNKTFKDFPFHQNLKDLKISFGVKYDFLINFDYFQDFEGMCDSLKQIAIKCPKLETIEFYSTIRLKNISEVKQLFILLTTFPSLKRLKICLKYETFLNLDIHQWFSFDLFKELPKITHLSLRFYGKRVNESVLKDIDIYLPNLQYLEIISSFKGTPEGLTQMTDILSRLSRLQTIKVRFHNQVDYKPIRAMFIEKCVKIKIITLY